MVLHYDSVPNSLIYHIMILLCMFLNVCIMILLFFLTDNNNKLRETLAPPANTQNLKLNDNMKNA